MRFIRLFLRGLKDAYDQFVLVIVVSTLWAIPPIAIIAAMFAGLWLLIPLFLIPLPPATVALFRMLDPRNTVRSPELVSFFGTMKNEFKTSWGIAGITLPVILVLLWNANFFRGSDTLFALMVPLWLVMAFIVLLLMLYAFATVATMEAKVRNAFRGATYLLVMWPFSSALMMILLALLNSLFAVLVLPLIFFGPGVSAAVINRFALTGFKVEIIDPEAPTSERRTEVAKGLGPDDGGWLRRLRGGQRRQEGRR